MALNATQMILDSYTAFPAMQWEMAIKAHPVPSSRPPDSFWHDQRTMAIEWLARYGVVARLHQGRVFIGETMVDRSYLR